MIRRYEIALLLALPVLTMTTGCEALGDLLDDTFDSQRSVVVDVFSTHHATPSEGVFPERGSIIELDTDMGWHVVLNDAYVTTTGVELHHCDGRNSRIDMYWGAHPEALDEDDLDLTGIGGVTLEAGEYCGATLHYGPFSPSDVEDAFKMGNPEAIGSSTYLAGTATKGDASIPFVWRTEAAFAVEVDLSDHPMGLGGGYDAKVTVAKTYDRFFDGIDFGDVEPSAEDVDSLVIDTLRRETRVFEGTSVGAE